MTFERRPGRTEAGAAVERVVARPGVASDLMETVYVRHYADVYRYVLALTRSHDDADEITADTFARAIGSWASVPEPPLPWLLLVARRIATDRWRRARRLARIVAGGLGRDAVDGPERQTEFWPWFASISRLLTPRQREVLVLRYLRDLPDEQIGQVMGLSASGVRSLAARALAVLRSHPEVL